MHWVKRMCNGRFRGTLRSLIKRASLNQNYSNNKRGGARCKSGFFTLVLFARVKRQTRLYAVIQFIECKHVNARTKPENIYTKFKYLISLTIWNTAILKCWQSVSLNYRIYLFYLPYSKHSYMLLDISIVYELSNNMNIVSIAFRRCKMRKCAFVHKWVHNL